MQLCVCRTFVQAKQLVMLCGLLKDGWAVFVDVEGFFLYFFSSGGCWLGSLR